MKKSREELEKQLEELETELSFFESYQPVNNMGKWSTSVRIESLQKEITKIKKRIKNYKDEKQNTYYKTKTIQSRIKS